ncbi:MAG: acyltransferase, partial [Propionibacteriales bacterium]|nr:acyltransferase [Propionibacteriales bacterium]
MNPTDSGTLDPALLWHGTTAMPAPDRRRGTMTAPTALATEQRTHRYDIDLLRVLCGAAVILGHTGSVFIKATDNDPDNGAAVYWVGHLAEAINPWAVPTFFAVAGWAVLAGAPPRDESTMLRRIWRHFVPLVVWVGLYVLLGKVMGDNTRPIPTLLWQSALDGGVASNHLWYLYSYIPLIAVLGLTVLFIKGQRPWILAVIAAVMAVGATGVVMLDEVLGLGDPDVIWGIAGYQVIYAVLGAFLLHKPSRRMLLTTGSGLLLLICATLLAAGAVLGTGVGAQALAPAASVTTVTSASASAVA